VLDGPRCGACGQRYLAAPAEFSLNGMNRRADSPPSIRVVHKPCKKQKKKKACFTVGMAHGRQKKLSDNIRIARSIMNSAGVLDIRRIIQGIDPDTRCGISRIYDRIFWLQEVMLAYEQAQHVAWRDRLSRLGVPARIRISHDDLILGVNWQTDRDRRVTPLNCSISADADSGYVYRADVDFDPRSEPLDLLETLYRDENGLLKNIGREYRQEHGAPFTVPLFHFQRPSGRLDERALFGACLSRIEAFRETKVKRIIEQTPGKRDAIRADLDQLSSIIKTLAQDWFGFPDLDVSFRPSFSGATVRQVYTKAAHFAALRQMLPATDIVIMTEQEGTISRTLTFLQRSAYPQVWVHSPIQSSGETNKIVGMPIVRRDMRQHLKRLRFDAQITDPALRRFVGEEVWRATLQPASTFMNSLRERLSPAARAASGGARSGGAYIQGVACPHRVVQGHS
jgi:hypothetical protein